jgi:hypothetical protein
MTDDDNPVLRLLREIRGEQSTQRPTMEGIQGRITSIDRHMEDVKESVACALGLAAHTGVAYGTTGQRPDRLNERVAALEARIESLEER